MAPPPPFEGAEQGRVDVEGPVFDRFVDAHQVLEGDAPGPERQVSDLAVAHLAGRQPDRPARRVERGVRERRPEAVEVRRVGGLDGVPGTGRRKAPPLPDDERYEGGVAPPPPIPTKDPRASDRPPTSAPSPP